MRNMLLAQPLIMARARFIIQNTDRKAKQNPKLAFVPHFFFRCHIGMRRNGEHRNICMSAAKYHV